jgi:hypothetical protein
MDRRFARLAEAFGMERRTAEDVFGVNDPPEVIVRLKPWQDGTAMGQEPIPAQSPEETLAMLRLYGRKV